MSVTEFLTNNSGIMGLAVGVISIVFAVFVWMNEKRKKEFTYARTSFQLISGGISSIERLKLLYDDIPIPDLTVTRFTIWNSGTEEIKREDLYEKEPLRILNEKDQILNASIIPESDEKGKFNLSICEKRDIRVDFECAEKKDGVVIQVIHSGNADELKPMVGIKGGKPIQAYQTRQGFGKKKHKSKVQNKGIIAFWIWTLFALFITINMASSSIASHDWFIFIVSVVIILSYSFLFVLSIRETFNLPIPSKLRKYVEVEITS